MDKDFTFRDLKAEEITLKAFPTEQGVSVVLYKDARVDINILNETVGPKNWTRLYPHGASYCEVSIWDEKKGAWVSKGDYGQCDFGTNSEKGTASDSFKRACFNWGIGIELYTSPVICIPRYFVSIVAAKNGLKVVDDLYVSDFKVVDHVITDISIISSLSGQTVYSFVNGKEVKVSPKLSGQNLLRLFISKVEGLSVKDVAQEFKLNGMSSDKDFEDALSQLKLRYPQVTFNEN